MPKFRNLLIGGLYCNDKKAFMKQIVDAYFRKELDYVCIVPDKSNDDLCIKCQRADKPLSCYQPEDKLVLQGSELNFGSHPLSDLEDL